MNIDPQLVRALLNGSATDAQKSSLASLLEQEENTYLVAHSHRNGTSICRVILDANTDPKVHLKRYFVTADPDSFSFHVDADDMIDCIEPSSSVATYDFRGIDPLTDEQIINELGGVDELVYNFGPIGSLGDCSPL